MSRNAFNRGPEGPGNGLDRVSGNARARLDALRDPSQQLVGIDALYQQWERSAEGALQALRPQHQSVKNRVQALSQDPRFTAECNAVDRLLDRLENVSQPPVNPQNVMAANLNLGEFLQRVRGGADGPSPFVRIPEMQQLYGELSQLHAAYRGATGGTAPGVLQNLQLTQDLHQWKKDRKDPAVQKQINTLLRMVGGLAFGSLAAMSAYMAHKDPNSKSENALLLYGGLAATCLFGREIFKPGNERVRDQVRFLDKPDFQRISGRFSGPDMAIITQNIQENPGIRGQLRAFHRARTVAEKNQLAQEIINQLSQGTTPSTRPVLERMLNTTVDRGNIPSPLDAVQSPIPVSEVDLLVEYGREATNDSAQRFVRSYLHSNLGQVGLPFVQRLMQHQAPPLAPGI